jgi:flavin-dependent dehydrogenase
METRTCNTYDVAIVGGGLAGLATSIELAKKGHSVVLFEKEHYPFHKVCGEYLSMESWNYLNELGIPLSRLNLPVIDTLQLTSADGTALQTRLPLGGFGISRHKLDHLLSEIAISNGVHLMQGTKVNSIGFKECFEISFDGPSSGRNKINAKVCCASYGKRSNIDIKWKRQYLENINKKNDNYIAVKYHVKVDHEKNMIGLHNFKDGYGGISAVENDEYCFCYMTKAELLKRNNNNIEQLEQNVLAENPYLQTILKKKKNGDGFPITISQINFQKKTTVEHHVLMLGDAAGMIAPLCGNGMSMALHTGKLVSPVINDFLENRITRNQMENRYSATWKNHFRIRVWAGRQLQKITGHRFSTNTFVKMMKQFPFLCRSIIKMTHGKPF